MNPETETFLDNAFRSIQPSSPDIGRVVVEPDYEVNASEADAASLRSELLQCLREQSPDAAALVSHDGFEVKISSHVLLTKYIRRVTLHQDKLDGSWVEIAPPGNWI
jgi:hypothetical protein